MEAIVEGKSVQVQVLTGAAVGRRELDMLRPNGAIETVDVTARFFFLTPALLAKIADECAKAGHGTLIAAREYVPALPTHTRCARCNASVETATAYNQQEWARLGAGRVKMTSYYCSSCASMLQAIGMGETSAMDERATAVPVLEPATKED